MHGDFCDIFVVIFERSLGGVCWMYCHLIL